MATVVISGAIANKYLNGGAVWTRLSYALGFKQLGFKVYFVEQIDRESCKNKKGNVADFDSSVNVQYFRRVMEKFGLADSACLTLDRGEKTWGFTYREMLELAETADLLVNISGHLTIPELKKRFRRKAFIDQDPGFTQFWHAEGIDGCRLDGHDFYFTIGENIGAPECVIPTDGFCWRTTRQPVLLDLWPVSNGMQTDRFTTIGGWRGSYGPVQYGGRTFGVKAHEFRKFMELPKQTPQMFEIALDIHPADEKDLNSLRNNGWQIVDPRVTAADPASFRHYVQTSGAEFSVAQGIYVDTNSGWFSDRTTRYLASGKPALVQDTGFSRNYPVGEGLIAFRTLDDAIEGAARIAKDYDKHCRAARSIAEEYFDSDKVLGELIDQVGLAP